jgi:pimeloyl-ACP methyl ester carboxylesterase
MEVLPPIRPYGEHCTLTQLPGDYRFAPTHLVEADNENRLHVFLRGTAEKRDPLEILTRGAVASFAVAHAAALTPFLPTLPLLDMGKGAGLWAISHPQMADALADLSVTGRSSFTKFRQVGPRESLLFDRVMALMNGWPEASQENVLAALRETLDRAYRVARVLCRHEPRDVLEWIAVAAEDDPPHRPVNVPTAPYPQYNLTVKVAGIDVVTRFMIASDTDFIASPPVIVGGTGIDLPREMPGTPQPVLPEGDVIVYIHGHSSRLEEATDLVSAFFELGRQRGKPFIVIAMDLPCCGYSSMFDHTDVAPEGASDYPTGYPILEFIEEFIVGFVDALDNLVQNHLKDRIVAVIGGSLGGNMGLRLGRRSEPWLGRIVAWSPASVWNSFGYSWDPFKGLATSTCRDRMNQHEIDGNYGWLHSSSRKQYFEHVFENGWLQSALQPIGGPPPQPEMWYRDDWVPCKELHITGARLERQEIYNQWFRRWHWRVAREQLFFSHLDLDVYQYPSRGPKRYEKIRANVLLAAGEKDDYNFSTIYTATRHIAELMVNTPGRTLFLLDTGHSIHNERPQALAAAIVDFVGPTAGFKACLAPVYELLLST